MDKLSMEELGFFLYMEEMERQQREAQEAQGGEEDDREDGQQGYGKGKLGEVKQNA